MISLNQDHGFFDGVVALLMVVAGGDVLVRLGGGVVDPLAPSDVAYLNGKEIRVGLRWFPYAVLEPISRNSWPAVIEFDEGEPADPAAHFAMPKRLGGMKKLIATQSKLTLIDFFETNRAKVAAIQGADCYGWPPVWNFARVVRNAFGHGGFINFRDAGSESVTWRTLSYSPKDNGRVVMWNDLSPVDIIYLMLEMHCEL